MNFNMTEKDYATVLKILDRMTVLAPRADRLAMAMDLEAAHSNGCPLDLDRLLAFDADSFYDDLDGISRNIDRDTGKLMHGFLPRCAKVEKPAKTRRILTIRETIIWTREVPAEVNEENAEDWMESNDAWPQSGSWVEGRTFHVEEVSE